MKLTNIARVPPAVVDLSSTALDAIRAMVDHNVGAIAVATEGKISGIVSERDIIRKVTYHNLPADMTPVAEVMTKEVESIKNDSSPQEALHLMLRHHIRHLPIVDDDGNVLAILSIRDLLQSMQTNPDPGSARLVSG
jgi:CBS domain-containing protein